MGKASSTGLKEVPMKVTSIGTILKVMGYTDGEMIVGYSKENEKLIRSKVWVYSYGLIRTKILVNIRMTRSAGMVFSFGLIIGSTKEEWKMVNNIVILFLLL